MNSVPAKNWTRNFEYLFVCQLKMALICWICRSFFFEFKICAINRWTTLVENGNSKFFCNEKNISCPFQNALRHVGYIFVIITIKLRCQYQIHFFLFAYAMSGKYLANAFCEWSSAFFLNSIKCFHRTIFYPFKVWKIFKSDRSLNCSSLYNQ